jgi:hypothetical protein
MHPLDQLFNQFGVFKPPEASSRFLSNQAVVGARFPVGPNHDQDAVRRLIGPERLVLLQPFGQ